MNDFFIFLVWLYQILEVTIKNDQEHEVFRDVTMCYEYICINKKKM